MIEKDDNNENKNNNKISVVERLILNSWMMSQL